MLIDYWIIYKSVRSIVKILLMLFYNKLWLSILITGYMLTYLTSASSPKASISRFFILKMILFEIYYA